MKKYTSDLKRRMIVNKILKTCKGTFKHNLYASFGLDYSSYDEKKDMYVYMPSDRSYIVGKWRELCFEYNEGRLYCFKPVTNDPTLIGAFVARVNGFEVEGKVEPIYYPKVTGRGEHLNLLYEKVTRMAIEEEIIELDEKRKNPTK